MRLRKRFGKDNKGFKGEITKAVLKETRFEYLQLKAILRIVWGFFFFY